MTDPLRRDLDDLAVTVDVDAAAGLFERRRRRRFARHRAVLAGSMVAVVAVVAVGLSVADRDRGHDVTSGGPDSGVVPGEIGACGPSLSGEPFSFADLFEQGLAWVAADGVEAEPFPEYDDYVRDFFGRTGADDEQLASVSYEHVEFVEPVVRRSGAASDVEYEGSGRVAVVSSATVRWVGPDDTVVAAISQSLGDSRGDPTDVDFVETLAIVHPDGTVEFSGNCAEAWYTKPFQRAAAAMISVDGSDVGSEADVLDRMIDDPAFAEEAIAASIEESPGPPDWSSRPVRERAIDESNVPAEVRDRLELVTFRFEMDPSLLSSPQSLCFLTNEGWAGCTVLNATDFENSDGIARELTPLSLPIPHGSWIEVHLTDSPTYDQLGDSHPLARYEPTAAHAESEDPAAVIVTLTGEADDAGRVPPTVTAAMRRDA